MRKHRILVVEDQDAVRFGFSRYLLKEGYDVCDVRSLIEARHQTKNQVFDAIILDLDLPDGNGFDWVPEVKRRYPEIAIVIVSASDRKKPADCLAKGADHFLTKPVSMPQLHATLVRILREKETP